jgi:exodeoxyribonuclease VIII
MYDVMLDLETLGTKSGCVVLSIGAVLFDRPTGAISKEFYRVIDIQSCLAAGLTIDQSTWNWWLQQSDEARVILFDKKAQQLKNVLYDFDLFLSDITYKKQDIKLWGNGSDFDQPILSTCYDKLGMTQPWIYYNNRCHRTFKNVHPEIKPEPSGIYHNALDDAKYQVKQHALVYQAIYNSNYATSIETK